MEKKELTERELEIVQQWGYDGLEIIHDQLSKININPIVRLSRYIEMGLKILPYEHVKVRKTSYVPNKYVTLAAYYTLIECRYDKAEECMQEFSRENNISPIHNAAIDRLRKYIKDPSVMFIGRNDD